MSVENMAQSHAIEPTVPGKLTPFPYPGNKRRLAEWVVQNMKSHERFIVPFGGAGGILFNKAPSRNVVFNDINGDIIVFFRALRDRHDELAEYLRLIPYHAQQYREWKAEWDKGWRPDDDIKHAGQFYFLQRASFGGDQTGFRTVCDGRKNSSSQYFNSIDRLPRFSERLEGVILTNTDYSDLIQKYGDDRETLFYLDPPYKRGTQRYDWVDFTPGRFSNWCARLEGDYEADWMVSSASVPASIQPYPTIETDLVHQISGERQVTEKLTMNYHPDEVRLHGAQQRLTEL